MYCYLLVFIGIIHCIEFEPEEWHQTQTYNDDETKSVWDVALYKDVNYEDNSEYGYGFWSKWMITGPIYMTQLVDWYSISRLTLIQNNIEDQVLAIDVGTQEYRFMTLSDQGIMGQNLKHNDKLEGEWNYLYYSYSSALKMARGFVLFDDGNVYGISIDCKHKPANHIRFNIKKQPQMPAFNGIFSNIAVRIGNAYIDDDSTLRSLVISKYQLSTLLSKDIFPKTINLIGESMNVTYDKQTYATYSYVDVQPQEYSISGWIKWTVPLEARNRNMLLRLSHRNNFENKNTPGDKMLFLQKVKDNYQLESYSCVGQQCDNVHWQIELKEEHYSWHFIYLAYSRKMQKIFQFNKFDTRTFVVHKNDVFQYLPYGLYVTIQKDPYNLGYNGKLKQWFLNYGMGAYVENGFENDQLIQTKIGLFNGFRQFPQKVWKFPNDYLEVSQDGIKDLMETEIEPGDFQIQGVTEYGYGFWLKFVYNGVQQINELPDKVGIARLATAQLYETRRNLGDNALTVYLKPDNIVYETYTILDEANMQTTLANEIQLDGLWLFIYTAYKRTTDRTGTAYGCVFQLNGQNQCSFMEDNIVHYKIESYIFYSAGSLGRISGSIPHLNGYLHRIRLYFGDNSFIPQFDENEQKLLTDSRMNSKWILKSAQQYQGDYDDNLNKSPDIVSELDNLDEYSIELWFKQEGKTKYEQQCLFQLAQTQSPENIKIQQQDNLLSGFVDNESSILLKTYSFNSPKPQTITDIIKPTHLQDKQQWTYIYFGYQRGQINYYIQTKSETFQKKVIAMHRIPRYIALFKGNDQQQNQLFGKIDYLLVNLGIGSYREQFYKKSESFLQGLKLFPTSFHWKQYFNEVLSISATVGQIEQEFESGDQLRMDGQRNYGYGFWLRYMTAYPIRAKQRTKYAIIATLTATINKQELNLLSSYQSATKNAYRFKTYNVIDKMNEQSAEAHMTESQESVWNYLYVSYSADAQSLIAFVRLGQAAKILRVSINKLEHLPINGQSKFTLGKQQNYDTYNGQIANILVGFDGTSFVEDIKQFNEIIKKSIIPVPDDQTLYQQLVIPNTIDYPNIREEITEQVHFPREYSVYGWFKASQELMDDMSFSRQSLMHLSITNEILLGYNTLTTSLVPNGYQFQTYSTLEQSKPLSWLKQVPLDKSFGAWTYIWIGYSQIDKSVDVLIKCVDAIEIRHVADVEHYLSNIYYLEIGKQEQQIFDGQVQQVGFMIGKGSFRDLNKVDILPEIQFKSLGKMLIFRKEEIVKQFDHQDILENQSALLGSTEYSVQVWTRWLSNYPDHYSYKGSHHNILRMARRDEYEDCKKLGDRIFLIQVGKGFYQFSTYDSITEQCSKEQQIEYQYQLEGQWNLVYFGYKSGINKSMAKGVVYFQKHNELKQLEFNVEHIPLAPQAVLSLGKSDFNSQQFNGVLRDLIVCIGYGFQEDNTQILKFTSIPELDANIFKRHNLVEKDIQSDDITVKHMILDVFGVYDYGVYGWFKEKSIQEDDKLQILFRIGTNQQINDEFRYGDDTLMLLSNDKLIKFISYNAKNIDEITNDSQIDITIDVMKQQQFQWMFFYYGYSSLTHTLIAYLRYPDTQEFKKTMENVYHLVPSSFYIDIGEHFKYTKFQGEVEDINIVAGKSSFIDNNIYTELGSQNIRYLESATLIQ